MKKIFFALAMSVAAVSGASQALADSVTLNACTDGWQYSIDESGNRIMSLSLQKQNGNGDFDLRVQPTLSHASLIGSKTGPGGYNLTLTVPDLSLMQVFSTGQTVYIQMDFVVDPGSNVWAVKHFAMQDAHHPC